MSTFSGSSSTSNPLKGTQTNTTQNINSIPSFSNSQNPFPLKLNPTNYLSWKTQILPLLRGHNLLRFVDGSETAPSATLPDSVDGKITTVPNPAYAAWYQQDQTLLSQLISSLREDLIPLVIDAVTSRDLWVILETAYASPSTARVLNLKLSLQELRQNDDSIADFLYKAKGIADQLNAAGCPVSRSDFSVTIYRGLRSEFHNVVAVLTDRVVPPSFEELLGRLQSDELIISNSHGSILGSPQPVVNYSNVQPYSNQMTRHNNKGRNNNNRGNQNSYSRNNNRGKSDNRGGYQNSNPGQSWRNNYRGSNTFNNSGNQLQCQICHRSNHTADKCYQRYNPVTPPSANMVSMYPSSNSIAGYNWFPDTGTTHHATRDISALSHSQEYTGTDMLQVGDGNSLSIHNIGSSSLPANNCSLQLNNILHVPSLQKSLLFVSQFTKDNNVYFEFHPSCFFVKIASQGSYCSKARVIKDSTPSLNQTQARLLLRLFFLPKLLQIVGTKG